MNLNYHLTIMFIDEKTEAHKYYVLASVKSQIVSKDKTKNNDSNYWYLLST